MRIPSKISAEYFDESNTSICSCVLSPKSEPVRVLVESELSSSPPEVNFSTKDKFLNIFNTDIFSHE